jgi:hypothetical protein
LERDISKAQPFRDYLTVQLMNWSGQLISASRHVVRFAEWMGISHMETYNVSESLDRVGVVAAGHSDAYFCKLETQELSGLVYSDM